MNIFKYKLNEIGTKNIIIEDKIEKSNKGKNWKRFAKSKRRNEEINEKEVRKVSRTAITEIITKKLRKRKQNMFKFPYR